MCVPSLMLVQSSASPTSGQRLYGAFVGWQRTGMHPDEVILGFFVHILRRPPFDIARIRLREASDLLKIEIDASLVERAIETLLGLDSPRPSIASSVEQTDLAIKVQFGFNSSRPLPRPLTCVAANDILPDRRMR